MGDKWHVVTDLYEPAHAGLVPPIEEMRVWTLSKDPLFPGWNTDSGKEGFGLTKTDAQFLADAANEKLALGRPLPENISAAQVLSWAKTLESMKPARINK